MKRARTSRAGLTMLEVIIATIILSAIVGMSAYLVWSSSNHATSAEAALQLENTAREALNVMAAELRQAKRAAIQQVETTPKCTIRTEPQFVKIHDVSVGAPELGNAVTAPEDTDFDAIRFDLIDPRNTFVLAEFKNSTERIYTVQYWWQVDFEEQKKPAGKHNGPNGRDPDNQDDNANGVVDEGSIMKMETWFKTDKITVDERKVSTVLRNVKKLTFRVPKAVAAPPTGGIAWSSDRIEIKIDLEIQDPKHGRQKIQDKAGKEVFLIQKTVSTTVDFRN